MQHLMYKVQIDPDTADKLVAAVLRDLLKDWRKESKKDKYYKRLAKAAKIVLKQFTV